MRLGTLSFAAAACAASASAEDRAEDRAEDWAGHPERDADRIGVEPNKLEPVEGGRRAPLLIENEGDALERLSLDLVMFDRVGVFRNGSRSRPGLCGAAAPASRRSPSATSPARRWTASCRAMFAPAPAR